MRRPWASVCVTSPISISLCVSYGGCCVPVVASPFFSLWFDRIVPVLGKVLPGGKAYAYLPASVKRFPGAEELASRLAEAGFGAVRFTLLGGSIVALHTGVAEVTG